MKRRIAVAVTAAALAVGVVVTAAPAMATARVHRAPAFDGRAYLRTHGYLPLRGVKTLERAKAYAAAHAPQGAVPVRPGTGRAPKIGAAWQGVNNTGLTPPDANGAIGPKRYVEIVNVNMGIYDRTGAAKGTGLLQSITGHGGLSDPMVLWDPDTQRFYFNVWDTNNATMDWGFSKSSTPNAVSTTDWCSYETSFGYATTNAPDYPKLGQTKNFILIGVNFYPSFSSDHATSGDLLWTQKPKGQGTITTCPAEGKHGIFKGLKNGDGTQAFTPVPAIQADPSGSGYVVASTDIECPPICGKGTQLTLFKVTNNGGQAAMKLKGKSVTVGKFTSPPDAPQKGTSDTIDTLDGRLTHAISAIDPKLGKTTIWTSQTVAGGAGSELRWYELKPGKKTTLVQSGAVNDSKLYVYNGGVSPDRAVDANGNGTFGKNIVIGVTTSSANDFASVQMVSKVGSGSQSALVMVKAGTVAETDFSCSPTCRWGDYSGATPDPAPPAGQNGEVWLTNELPGGSHISTWNWEAKP